MNFSVNQTAAARSATEKKHGQNGHRPQEAPREGGFVAALRRLDGESGRRDGFAAAPPAGAALAEGLQMQSLRRQVLWVNGQLLRMLKNNAENAE